MLLISANVFIYKDVVSYNNDNKLHPKKLFNLIINESKHCLHYLLATQQPVCYWSTAFYLLLFKQLNN